VAVSIANVEQAVISSPAQEMLARLSADIGLFLSISFTAIPL
jgi:hypothetical protein